MKTYNMYIYLAGGYRWIQVQGRDIYQAKDTAKRMYGNDIKFYQYNVA